MGAIEDKRRQVLADLGMGIRAAKDTPDNVLANYVGDVAILVSAAKENGKGADALATTAIKAVEQALEATAKRHEADKKADKPALDRRLVGNRRDNLLILLDLAESKGKAEAVK